MLPADDRDAGTVLAADDGRIVVWGDYRRLVRLNEGKRLGALPLASFDPASVRLTGSHLILVRRGAVEVRDAATGKLLHRWATAPATQR